MTLLDDCLQVLKIKVKDDQRRLKSKIHPKAFIKVHILNIGASNRSLYIQYTGNMKDSNKYRWYDWALIWLLSAAIQMTWFRTLKSFQHLVIQTQWILQTTSLWSRNVHITQKWIYIGGFIITMLYAGLKIKRKTNENINFKAA